MKIKRRLKMKIKRMLKMKIWLGVLGLLLWLPVTSFGGEVLIDIDEEWRYLEGYAPPPKSWNQLNFDDSDWLRGESGFGYGDEDDATLLPEMQGKFTTLYLRKKFVVTDLATVKTLFLNVDYDDGFVAYLNGTEVVRVGLDESVDYDSLAENHEAIHDGKLDMTHPQNYNPLPTLEPFNLNRFIGLLKKGTNLLAIEVHNATLDSSDLTMIPQLVADEFIYGFVIASADTWAYRIPAPTLSDQAEPNWTDPRYNDGGWMRGPSGFGYGDEDDRTILPAGTICVYTRKDFWIEDKEKIGSLILQIDYDDGYIVYLNGREIARSNAAPYRYYASVALTKHEAVIDKGIKDTIKIDPALLVKGKNWLAISGHNFKSPQKIPAGDDDMSLCVELLSRKEPERGKERK
ncbi:MAG: hypothetical protein AB1797_00040 [bacterium]